MEKLKLLSKIALTFKNINNFDQDMSQTLKDIGEFLDVSRICIITNPDNETASSVLKWHNQGDVCGLENIDQLPYHGASSWNPMFVEQGYICADDIDHLPQDIVDVLGPRQVKSLLAYPLMREKKIKGYICFHECRYKRQWKAEEFEVLNTISGIISQAYERKFFQEKIIESEKRFFLALDKTKAGLWDLDMVNNKLYLSSMWKRILGYAEDEIEDSLEAWQALWHPDEKETMQTTVDDYLQGKTDSYEVIYRLKHKDGKWRWILTRGGILKDDLGMPYRWIGTHIDITAEREQALELERFFSVNLDLLCIVTMEGQFIKTNKAWEHILGYSSAELKGRNFLDFVHPEDIPKTLKTVAQLKQDEEVISFVNRYMGVDGTYHHIEWNSNPYEGVIYAAARDITKRIEYEKRILDNANKDALTNIYNRRYVFRRAEEIIEEYKRTTKVFSVSILDIDFFKTINDNYGH